MLMTKKRIIMKLDKNGYGEINISEPLLKLIKQGYIELIAEYDGVLND